MNSESATSGAQFSAPGFPQTDGVSFNTSVNNGALGRWVVEARQPLISRERLARSRQLELSADIAGLEWQGARQVLMLEGQVKSMPIAIVAHRDTASRVES